MRRDLLAIALFAAGLLCAVLVLYLAKGCSGDERVLYLAILLVLGGPLLVAVAAFLRTQTRSARPWTPWVAALVTMLLGTAGLAALALDAVIDTCTR